MATPRGYAVDPVEPKRPKVTSYQVNDEDTKISFSCGNGSLFLKLSSVLMFLSCILQVCI